VCIKEAQGTEVVKRLEHVIIQFDTQNIMCITHHSLCAWESYDKRVKYLPQFTTKLNQIKDLAKLRLSQFVSLTRVGPEAGIAESP
jgi:hypothetical protein